MRAQTKIWCDVVTVRRPALTSDCQEIPSPALVPFSCPRQRSEHRYYMSRARVSKRAQLEASKGGAATWAKITALGRQPGAINLGQGFPDFECSQEAKRGAVEALERGASDQYSPIQGTNRLVNAISKLYKRMYPAAPALDPATDVCVMSSGTEALFCSVMGMLDPGDEVVFFEPFFPWYLPVVRLSGGVARVVTLHPPSFDLISVEEKVRAAFSDKTRICVFNTPHNPTGHVASREELELVAELCKQYDVVCISDEVYEANVYEGQHLHVCEVEGMWDRTLTLGSASKLLSLTGWRVGWVCLMLMIGVIMMP